MTSDQLVGRSFLFLLPEAEQLAELLAEISALVNVAFVRIWCLEVPPLTIVVLWHPERSHRDDDSGFELPVARVAVLLLVARGLIPPLGSRAHNILTRFEGNFAGFLFLSDEHLHVIASLLCTLDGTPGLPVTKQLLLRSKGFLLLAFFLRVHLQTSQGGEESSNVVEDSRKDKHMRGTRTVATWVRVMLLKKDRIPTATAVKNSSSEKLPCQNQITQTSRHLGCVERHVKTSAAGAGGWFEVDNLKSYLI